MNKSDRGISQRSFRQSGTTLIVALVLLLLASLMGLFALNVGIFAQRTSAADLRARIVHETLEAALSQGIEYIKNNRTTLIDPNNPNSSTYWTQCGDTDTTFPCGTVPKCATDPTKTTDSTADYPSMSCSAGSANARRSNMYYYKNTTGTGAYDVNGTGDITDAMDVRSLPIASAQRITSTNGYTVNYGVGALMCMVKKQVSGYSGPTQCTTVANQAQGTYLFTVTAVGSIPGESAATTLSMTFGESPKIPGAVNAPTVVASSNLIINGNATFVTDQDGGGYGVPITVWSRDYERTNGAGTMDTCYYEDWIRNANGINANSTYSFALNSDGTNSTVVTCSGNGNKTCSCSTTISAGQGSLTFGSDILTNQANNPQGDTPVCPTSYPNCKPNYNVQPAEYPCDLFQYIFGSQAWQDTNGDYFCETRVSQVSQKMGDGSTQTVNADEAYLYTNAALILSTAHPTWPTSGQTVSPNTCAGLIAATRSSSFTGGIVWDQTGCSLTGTIGWPDKPVAWVADGSTSLQDGTVFGLVFVRDTNCPGAGSCTTPVGGGAHFTTRSTGTIYGAAVVMGDGQLNGSAAIIYNGTVLNSLKNLQATNPASQVPGSWTDRYVY